MKVKVKFVAILALSVLAAPSTSRSQEKRWLDPRLTELQLPPEMRGPFIRLRNGSLMTIEGDATRFSMDEGRTWSEAQPIYAGPKPGIPGFWPKTSQLAGNFLETQKGTLVYAFMDMSTMKFGWDNQTGEPLPDTRSDVWTIRSEDHGKTWTDRQKIFGEFYCGDMINIIETKDSHIVVPVQMLLPHPGRNAVCTYVSADDGKTWKQSNIIDLGGHGNHDGAFEPTLVELKDGRVRMLIRTNLDRFWDAYSTDHGGYWRVIHPSDIDASSAPGYLARLASGRLVLVWNRLYPQGKSTYPRKSGQLCEIPASWQREELSIAFSEDDGKSWTEPSVMARDKDGLAYPAVFEFKPGIIWVTTRFNGELRVSLREEDFVRK